MLLSPRFVILSYSLLPTTTSHDRLGACWLYSDHDRCLGVVTKVDLMGKNKDALQRMLANEVLPLAMGRIGIRCRTQQEQLDGVGFDEVLNRESQVRKR